MTIVGTAEVVVHPLTAGFAAELETQTAPALATLTREAELAGAGAGGGLRRGVAGEAGKLEGDLAAAGAAGGRGLERGVSGGLGRLGSAMSVLPFPALHEGLERSAVAAEHAEAATGRFATGLGAASGPVLGLGAALAIGVGIAVDLGEKMQSADAAIAAASGTSVKAAKAIGDAFLGTAGDSTFSGQQMAAAFAPVAGQLKLVEGGALGAGHALKFMEAATALAEASQSDLTATTATLASVLQAFNVDSLAAAHVADVLYSAATSTGVGIGTLAAQLVKVHSRLGETGGSVSDLSTLLVDMTSNGITGRAAMSALNSGLNTLQKTATDVTTATRKQNDAMDRLSPAGQALAKQFMAGALSASEFKKQAAGLGNVQADLATQFVTAAGTAGAAQQKYRDLGVTAFDVRGRFVGMASIIDQLAPKFARMTKEQQLAAAATLFGTGAARQMTAVITAGTVGWDRASASVNKHGAAEAAAAKNAGTLHGELQTLGATASDLGTIIGEALVPVAVELVGVLLDIAKASKATVEFVGKHWEVLAPVLVAPVAPALAAWAGLRSGVTGVVSSIVNAVGKGFHEVESDASSVARGVEHAFASVPGVVVHELAALPGQVEHIGEQVVAGLAHGIENALGSAVHAAANLAGSLLGSVKHELGISSPSRITHGYGVDVSQGLADGIMAGAPRAHAAAQSVAQQVMAFFQGKGLTRAQAAGIVGNLQQESSLNPGSPGGYIAQWGGARLSALQAYAAQQGKAVTDLTTQLNFIWKELQGPESGSLAALRGTHTAGDAATAFSNRYERPGIPALQNRVRYANEAYAAGGGVSAPSQAAVTKAALDKEVAQQKAALAQWIVEQRAALAHGTAAQKAALAVEIIQKKAALATQIAGERAATGVQTKQQAAELRRQTADQKAATKTLNKLLQDVHSNNLAGLRRDLDEVHTKGLVSLEHSLSADHVKALAALSVQLVKVHGQAMKLLAADTLAQQKKDAAAAAATAAADQLARDIAGTQGNTQLVQDQGAEVAKAIGDATKVMLDQQAEVGLSGAALLAAQAQTAFDQITQSFDQQVAVATTGPGGADYAVTDLEQAQAANRLGVIGAAAAVALAQAQATLDIANAAAANAGAAPVDASPLVAASQPANVTFDLTFNGAAVSAGEAMAEIGWALRTGALPLAPVGA